MAEKQLLPAIAYHCPNGDGHGHHWIAQGQFIGGWLCKNCDEYADFPKTLSDAEDMKEFKAVELLERMPEPLDLGDRLYYPIDLSEQQDMHFGYRSVCPGCGTRNTFWSGRFECWVCLECNLMFGDES